MTHFEHALEYLERGWSIIPIKPGSKLPVIPSWRQYQKTKPTGDEVRRWWEQYPDANIALICGAISGVIVVDVDTHHGGVTDGLELPPTLVAKTGGGGFHYFYKWNKDLIGAKVGIRTGIDIRSEASYVVVAPSLHASGNLYEWMTDADEEIADPPGWLYVAKEDEKPKTNWEEFFQNSSKKGTRNMNATQLAGKIIGEVSPEMWDTLGYALLQTWNSKHAKPSLPETELKTIWESIKKTHVKNHGVPEPTTESPMASEEEKAILKTFVKNTAKGTYYLAGYLTQKYEIITIGEKEREIYVYQDGMYRRAENEVVLPEIQRILHQYVTKNAKNETMHKIADMTSFPRSVFTSTPLNLIPLQNGVYDRATRTLLPHDPSYRFLYQFPVKYDATAIAAKTFTFFREVLTDEQFVTMQEWIGYYFYRLYSFKKAVIFVGEGDTGKTTLLETIMHLLGKENISSVSLHKMTSDKFAAAQLYEKHGNLVDELSAKDITDTGNFKIATGGGSIAGEYKFGNQFSFQNFSKFTFACNRIPDVTDFDDEAYFARWIVMRFSKKLNNKIPNFIAQLKTDEERSGLFNFAMEGLDRLIENGQFSHMQTAVDTKVEMMSSGSSMALFVAEMLIHENGSEMSKADMYDKYTDFCEERALPADTIEMFGRRLHFYASYVKDGLIYDTDNPRTTKRVRGWRNAKVKPNEAEQKAIDEFNGEN